MAKAHRIFRGRLIKLFEYLKYLFEQLPNIDTENNDELDQFLSWSTTISLHCQS